MGRKTGAIVLGLAFLGMFSLATAIRTNNWSTYQLFLLTSVANHPQSPRANFSAAQYMIAAIDHTEGPPTAVVETARTLLNNGLKSNSGCLNCRFGLVVLDLHLDREPDSIVVKDLIRELREQDLGATEVSVSQFSYLVRWQLSKGKKMRNEDLKAIFDAALSNPRLGGMGRASIEAAFSRYYELVEGDYESALAHARAARDAWDRPWSYHISVVRLLRNLDRRDEALEALKEARIAAKHRQQHLELDDLHRLIANDSVTD
jgi:hypothetical protein